MLKYPKLIILYGPVTTKHHEKQQRMINGETTCMYRSMAKKFGEIIYLAKQGVNQSWERSYTGNLEMLANDINSQKNVVVWSVKHDKSGQKDTLLRMIKHPKVYYSCCSYNTINYNCDVSLVDTPQRLTGNAVLWVKGKDSEFWKPTGAPRLCDYVFVGRRGDKNEAYFINRLAKEVQEVRRIMWVGGEKHKGKIKKTHHTVICTPVLSPQGVINHLSVSKVGIILSEIPAEGFPQSFIEMVMVGLPVVYMGPISKLYKRNDTLEIIVENKGDSVAVAEHYLQQYALYSFGVRDEARWRYSLEKSYESILKGLGVD
jgi:hypothetical protein